VCTYCGLPHAGRRNVPVQRSEQDLLISLCQLAEETLTELKHIRSALAASGSVSSAQLEQDSKGQVKITVKAYAGSDVVEAGWAVLDEFGRLFRAVEERQMNGWQETVEAQVEA
jgi:hypothetical protein